MTVGFNVAVEVRRRDACVSEPCKSSQPAKCVSKTELHKERSWVCLCVICNNRLESRLGGMCRERSSARCGQMG